MREQLVSEFYRGLNLPQPYGKIRDRDLGVADTLIQRYGSDALSHVKVAIKHRAKVLTKTPLKWIGTLVRMPWVITNPISLDRKAGHGKPSKVIQSKPIDDATAEMGFHCEPVISSYWQCPGCGTSFKLKATSIVPSGKCNYCLINEGRV